MTTTFEIEHRPHLTSDVLRRPGRVHTAPSAAVELTNTESAESTARVGSVRGRRASTGRPRRSGGPGTLQRPMAVAAVGHRGCAVVSPPASMGWQLTNRGLAVVMGLLGALAVAAVVCVGFTITQILTSPLYLP